MNDRDKTKQQLIEELTQLRKQVGEQQSLNEQLTIFKTFAETAGQGFGMADMDEKIVYANAALASLFGESKPEHAYGKPPSTYYDDDYRRLHETEIFPVLQRDGVWQGELTMVSVTGEHIPVLQTSFTLTGQGGQPARRGVVITDLRRVNQAEEKLRWSETKYKALVESSPDAVLMYDLEGQIVFASPQAAEWHGVDDPSELIGRPIASLVVEQERELVQSTIRCLLESGIRRNDQHTGLRRDGTTFFGEVSSSVIRDASGKPEALMAVYRDITERKQAQEALRKAQQAMRRMLQASDHDRELITYEIHDGITQQLLGALMQFEACRKVVRGDPEECRSMCDAGLKALREASSEARSLMNRTRTPVLQNFGFAAAIAYFIDQFSEKPNGSEIIYRCEARFKRLQRVLENTIFRVAQEAITNACIHGKGEMVRVTLIQKDEEVILEVQDNGIGFDVAKVADDRFGLDGIRERTRLLGKDLEIESVPGQGTRIRATFPLIYRDE